MSDSDNGERSFRQDVYAYVKKKYKSKIEYLWKRYPNYGIFRHADNQKWYGLIMDVRRDKLGLSGEEYTDILNVKLDDLLFRDILIRQEGYLPGYHISRGNWISILLDGTVPLDDIKKLIDISYEVTASKETKQKLRPPKEWIVPANPSYYDICGDFDQHDDVTWKQGKGIRKGDTVYMYVGAPVSAMLYRCLVTETDIPYRYQDDHMSMSYAMKMKVLKRYDRDAYTLDVLRKCGIRAVRGPRSITDEFARLLAENQDKRQE